MLKGLCCMMAWANLNKNIFFQTIPKKKERIKKRNKTFHELDRTTDNVKGLMLHYGMREQKFFSLNESFDFVCCLEKVELVI